MVNMLSPKEGDSICDPACGTGGMLSRSYEHIRLAGGDPRTFLARFMDKKKHDNRIHCPV